MNATSVASSGQMALNPKTQNPSPAFGRPSAPRAHGQTAGASFGLDGAGGSGLLNANANANPNRRRGRLGDHQSDNEGGRPSAKVKNPFLKNLESSVGDGGGSSNGGKFQNKRRADVGGRGTSEGKKGGSDSERNMRKPRHLNNGGVKGQGQGGMNGMSHPRPTSASSMSSVDRSVDRSDDQQPDPFARRVHDRLRRDGIAPPAWPSQPSNPKNKAEMARFREQYEDYRAKARASLTKAGLIDDPEKRKTLQDAIDFRGICEEMCPEYEKITRITEFDVPQPEKDPSTSWADRSRMVKKLARSAAGQEAPLPMDVRSTGSLRRTLDYLIDHVLQGDDNLPGLHGFLWDRTRAIRRDFTFLSSPTAQDLAAQAYVLENIIRFHVTSLHLLSQEGKAGEDFVEQQELEQLGKALLSLRDLYDDCNAQGIQCENEAEFRAYYLVFHAHDSNTVEMLQRQWKPHLWRDSDEVRTAISLVEALQDTVEYHGPLKPAPSLAASAALLSYFRIVESSQVSYIMACFAECHFPHLRRSILRAMRRAMARPKDTINDVTAETLNRFLRFDTTQQALDFAKLHDIEAVSDPGSDSQGRQILLLNNKGPLPTPRLQHQFSRNIVERKRGGLSLPDVIHGAACPEEEPRLEEEDSARQPETATPQTSVSSSPFASVNQKPGFGFPGMPQGMPQVTTQAAGAPSNPFTTNPFASKPSTNAPPQTLSAPKPPTATGNAAVVNPFASLTSAAPSLTPTPALQVSQPDAANPKPTTNPFSSLLQPAAGGKTSTASFQFGSAERPGEPKLAQSTGPLIANKKPPSKPSSQPSSLFATGGGIGDGVKQPVEKNRLFPPSTTPTPTPAQTNAGASLLGGPFGVPRELAKPSFPESILKPGLETGSAPSIIKPPAVASPFFPPPGPISSTASSASLGAKPSQTPSLPPPSSGPPSTGGQPLSGPPKSLPFPKLGGNGGGQSTTPPSTPPRQPQLSTTVPRRPRDLLGDFTKWFVLGDNGLLHEFEVFMVESILSGVYDKFKKDEADKKRREQERRDEAQAKQFRTYNLQLKYFYRWKQNARERRLRQLRKSGREQFRAFRETQRAARQREDQETATKIAHQREEAARLSRAKEMANLLKKTVSNRQKAEEALLASGVLSGMQDEREAIARIVGGETSVSQAASVNGDHGMRSRSGSIASTASVLGGSKTRALREELLGVRPSRFRRSLPSFSPDGRSTPERTTQGSKSKVSERWRLKAMGIVKMPDGTALPESMAANEIRKGIRQSTAQNHGPEEAGSRTTAHKRKRAVWDEGGTPAPKQPEEAEAEAEAAAAAETHRGGILSEAESLIRELRAMRQEMEEGTTWFKAQNGRLQSEAMSRDESI